jgi:CCR4-NOT transcription complex subunit 7/8
MAGIDFKLFFERGIEIDYFGEFFTTSGLVLNDKVKWITFHGSYDFAYLLRVLSNQYIPDDEAPFNDLLSLYFPCFYDVRHMIRNATWLKGSLSRISNDLDIRRIGNTHQAGSDSLVTSKVFFKLVQHFNEHIDLMTDKNKLFGFVYKMYNDDFEFNNYNNSYYMPLQNGINKAKPLTNMPPYYGSSFNAFNNNNGGVNPMMFNNYNNSMGVHGSVTNPMNNFNPMYPQPGYDSYNFYNNYYGQQAANNGSFKPQPGSKDNKFQQN